MDQPHPSRDDRGAHRAPVAQREAHVDTVQRKLDAAWGGPAANPAPRYQSQADKPRGDTADLARIRDSLDRLAGRLGSMGVAESRQRPQPYREPEPRQRPAAPREPLPPHPPARAAESEQFAAIGRQMRDELHALRNQIADAFEALEHKRDSNGADEPMRDELHRLVDMVSRLDQQSRQAPDHLEDVSIELRNLHGLLQDMAGRDTSGIDGLTRSIETSYAELAGRMEEMIASLMNELPRSREDSELRGELSMLGENVAVIRDAIDRLPGRLSTGVIEEGLDKLAGSIEALSDSEERSLSR
ncbi:MAG: hypothetical protein VYD64_08155, partial [Pseudomonadota bacterium]|nr:hypothetical protein [Pseudomonadota bacterium]